MKITSIVLAVFLVFGISTPSIAEDERELIKLTPELQYQLLAEMRQLTYELDDLVSALAEGDFQEVRKIAIIQLSFGHNRSKQMLESGKPEDEVVATMEPFLIKRLKMFEAGNMGHGGGGGFAGLGQQLPETMRSMGQSMHASAVKLALSAKKAGKNPTADDYKAVLSDLQGMTSMCAACHQTFKIR